jgi:hypothetical protein
MDVWINQGSRSVITAFGFVKERSPSGPPGKNSCDKSNASVDLGTHRICHSHLLWRRRTVDLDYEKRRVVNAYRMAQLHEDSLQLYNVQN